MTDLLQDLKIPKNAIIQSIHLAFDYAPTRPTPEQIAIRTAQIVALGGWKRIGELPAHNLDSVETLWVWGSRPRYSMGRCSLTWVEGRHRFHKGNKTLDCPSFWRMPSKKGQQ